MRIILIHCFAVVCLISTPAWSVDYINHLDMEFETIQSGQFFMGACAPENKEFPIATPCPSQQLPDEDITPYELPQHPVMLKNAFQISIYEISLEQFLKFVRETDNFDFITDEFIQYNGLGRPVVQVSWDDVQAFITWLNATKPASDKGTYRLPSEAEWEYAARGGTVTRYSWGDEIEEEVANCAGCDSHWGGEQSAKVGSFEPNGFGLYDMLGNVSEWVQDCWNHNYVGAPVDGSAWLEGNCVGRPIRGGSWTNLPWKLRVTGRDYNVHNYRHFNIGFRLVRDIAGLSADDITNTTISQNNSDAGMQEYDDDDSVADLYETLVKEE